MKKFISALLCILILAGSTVTAVQAGYVGQYFSDGVAYHSGTKTTYTFDFLVSRVSYYSSNEALAIDNRTSMDISDGVLKCKEGKSFSFGSAYCLGDDYGLESGNLSFDLTLTDGSVSLGLRCSKTASNPDYRGLWITFDKAGKLKVYHNSSALTAEVDTKTDFSKGVHVDVFELADNGIELQINNNKVLTVASDGSFLGYYDGNGTVIAETSVGNDLSSTGYFTLYVESLAGFIDNVSYTNFQAEKKEINNQKIIDYSTWSATDDLNRTVSVNETVGNPKENRYVGVFYFLCWVGAGVTVTDNTKIYTEGGLDAVKAHFENHEAGEAYWAEPYFGYYRNTDTWVYRKHAYMLEAAGVDFIYLDISNAETFISGHTALFDTWLQIRKEGGQTPQIMFLNGDDPKTFQSNMQTLFTTVYSDGNWDKYSELFFMWDGKPLIFGNITGVNQTIANKIKDKFTVRGCWAWCDKDGYWSWLQEYDEDGDGYKHSAGGWGRDNNGKYESLAISLGHHASTSKGRSYNLGSKPKVEKNTYGYEIIEESSKGICFETQFKAAKYLIDNNVKDSDPFALLITGWNEWIAGCSYSDSRQTFAGSSYKYYYVDQFNTEYSRDAEPMRDSNGYGFGDNYYYQMIDYIRQFKGVSATPKADNQKTVNIYNKTSFDAISMKYDDTVGDTEHRNTMSYDANYRYINGSGRNDFDYAKISQDSKYLYFYVKCNDRIILDNSTNWMNLFINTDGDNTDGWEGFDYVLNRRRDSYAVTVEKFTDSDGNTEIVGGAYYAIDGDTMTVRLDKSIIGVEGLLSKMLFKWADNSTDSFDAMEFMDLGDTAPNDRYSFVYLCDSCEEYDTSVTLPDFAREASTTEGIAESQIKENIDNSENAITYRTVDNSFDFNEYGTGKDLSSGTPISEFFEFLGGTGSSTVRTEKSGANIVAKLNGYCDFRTWDDIVGSYSFSVDLGMIDFGNSAVYIRGEMPGALVKYNKRHSELAGQEIYQTFHYYETDWYAENGGAGASSVAGSGIGIYPLEDGLSIVIKKYANDGLTVASSSCKFAYPEEFNPKNMFNLKCVDDGETVEIYLNQDLVCTVEMSESGTVYESDGTDQPYYGHVEVFDAGGKNKLTVDNTRLNSRGSQLALTTRSQTMKFDNVYISYEEEIPTKSCENATQVKAVIGVIPFTPDTTLLDTLVFEIKDEQTTEAETELTTTQAETVADTTAEEAVTETQKSKKGCGGNITAGIIFAFIPTLLLLKKRKENN